MAIRLIFGVAIFAVKIAALKAHKYLTAADIFTLALNGGKNFYNIFFHFLVLGVGNARFRRLEYSYGGKPSISLKAIIFSQFAVDNAR